MVVDRVVVLGVGSLSSDCWSPAVLDCARLHCTSRDPPTAQPTVQWPLAKESPFYGSYRRSPSSCTADPAGCGTLPETSPAARHDNHKRPPMCWPLRRPSMPGLRSPEGEWPHSTEIADAGPDLRAGWASGPDDSAAVSLGGRHFARG